MLLFNTLEITFIECDLYFSFEWHWGSSYHGSWII